MFNDQTIGAIPAIRVIKDFFAVDIDRILFLFIPILIVLLILGIIESKRINKLKTWEVNTKEIIWKVKSIEYVRSEESGQIVNRYYTVEWINPFTDKLYIFSSDQYPYIEKHPRRIRSTLFWISKVDKKEFDEYTSQYVKIGDSVKVFVSRENADDYYLQDIVKDKR